MSYRQTNKFKSMKKLALTVVAIIALGTSAIAQEKKQVGQKCQLNKEINCN